MQSPVPFRFHTGKASYNRGVRRLRRIAFTCLTLLSVIAFVATVALWTHSQFASYWVGLYVGKFGLIGTNFRSYGGIDLRRLNAHWTSSAELQRFEFDSYPAETRSNPLWFVPRYHHRTFPLPRLEREIWDVRIPYWLMLLVSSVPPALWWRDRRKRNRVQLGHCQTCGYDLRATPARCPECGAAPAALPVSR
jgi:hypothetical protein